MQFTKSALAALMATAVAATSCVSQFIGYAAVILC